MGAKTRKDSERIDPAPRLGMVLIRYSLGMFERQELAAALGVASSQISMWESGDRPIPENLLERTARLRGLSRPLLAQLLREIRSFLQASEGRSRPARALAAALAVDLLPLLVEALETILSPLVQESPQDRRSRADNPAKGGGAVDAPRAADPRAAPAHHRGRRGVPDAGPPRAHAGRERCAGCDRPAPVPGAGGARSPHRRAGRYPGRVAAIRRPGALACFFSGVVPVSLQNL